MNTTIEQSKWWVTFDEKTSKVKGVSPTHVRSKKFTVIESHNDCCLHILSGRKNLRNYGMIQELSTGKWDIGEKSYRLDIRQLSKKLFKIEDHNPFNSDAHITFFTDDNMMNVQINYENLKRSMNLMGINEIARQAGTLLNLYITKKNNPDFLIQSISINPEELLKTGSIDYELIKIGTFNDWKDLSVYTRPIFKHYSVEYTQESIHSNHNMKTRSSLQRADINVENTAHIDIEKIDERTIQLINNISDTSKYILAGRSKLKFLIGDSTIDNLVGGFVVESDKILNNKDIKINLDFDFPDNPVIVYKNKHISVRYNKEKNNE
jgi:hypothetical protein